MSFTKEEWVGILQLFFIHPCPERVPALELAGSLPPCRADGLLRLLPGDKPSSQRCWHLSAGHLASRSPGAVCSEKTNAMGFQHSLGREHRGQAERLPCPWSPAGQSRPCVLNLDEKQVLPQLSLQLLAQTLSGVRNP